MPTATHKMTFKAEFYPYLIRARTERPRPQMLERELEALGHHPHELCHGCLLPYAEHPIVRPLGVVEVVALVTVERLL